MRISNRINQTIVHLFEIEMKRTARVQQLTDSSNHRALNHTRWLFCLSGVFVFLFFRSFVLLDNNDMIRRNNKKLNIQTKRRANAFGNCAVELRRRDGVPNRLNVTSFIQHSLVSHTHTQHYGVDNTGRIFALSSND